MTWSRDFAHEGESLRVTCSHLEGDRYEVMVGTRRHEVRAHALPDGRVTFELDGQTRIAAAARTGAGDVHVRVDGRSWLLPRHQGRGAGSGAAASGDVKAPMTGTVLDIAVELGQQVAKGDLVAVVTAMKMEHRLLAQLDGAVAAIKAETGQNVDEGTLLVRIEPSEE